ncbi:MAG: methyltransferase [Halobacteriales archaeon]
MPDSPDHQSPDPSQHREPLRLKATIGPREEFSFLTADGVASPGAFREPELGLLDVLVDAAPETLLVPDANYGLVGTVLGVFADAVCMTETSARAAGLCRENAVRNRVSDRTTVAITADLRALPTSFETAALAPTEYVPVEVVNQRIADAIATLHPGGTCYLAATPSTGLNRYHATLRELCEDVSRVTSAGTVTVLRGERPAAYDPPRYAEPRPMTVEIGGAGLTFTSYPGLFSPAELDAGTRALAERFQPNEGEHVLDLACGYGPLGIYARRSADCTVVLTDDDCVATACARQSAARSGVTDGLDVVTGDGVAGVRGSKFDRIVCNPPTHGGSGLLHELMAGASEVLSADGRLQLVHHQGVAFNRYLDPYFQEVTGVDQGEYRLVTARH